MYALKNMSWKSGPSPAVPTTAKVAATPAPGAPATAANEVTNQLNLVGLDLGRFRRPRRRCSAATRRP